MLKNYHQWGKKLQSINVFFSGQAERREAAEAVGGRTEVGGRGRKEAVVGQVRVELLPHQDLLRRHLPHHLRRRPVPSAGNVLVVALFFLPLSRTRWV